MRPIFSRLGFDRARVLRNAQKYLADNPVTVTAAQSARSAGGRHDFFSEGEYWWPDPKNPDGPYIQRDGMTNPDNFVEHRKFLMKLSVQAPALAAAWKLTHERRYSDHAAAHIRAWFVDEATRMNPNLQYVPLHPRQDKLEVAARRYVLRALAHEAGSPAFRRAGLTVRRLHRHVEEAASRFGCRCSDPQLLHSSTCLVGGVNGKNLRDLK